jgi:hypothetical protein
VIERRPNDLTTMAKKRKLSDLTTQETDIFLQMIENFKQALSEEDEDEKSVIASLDHVAAKLTEVQVSAFLPDDFWHSVTCLQ